LFAALLHQTLIADTWYRLHRLHPGVTADTQSYLALHHHLLRILPHPGYV
jgi:hypothetical protein